MLTQIGHLNLNASVHVALAGTERGLLEGGLQLLRLQLGVGLHQRRNAFHQLFEFALLLCNNILLDANSESTTPGWCRRRIRGWLFAEQSLLPVPIQVI